MRAAIVALATLVVVGLIGVATALFRPSSNDVPLEPITVEVPADVSPRAPNVGDVYPKAPGPDVSPAPVPDARTRVPPPPPAVTDVPPPPPAVVGDDDDDGDDDDGAGGDDD